MKASLITLLPVACFMQSALAAPAVAAQAEPRAIVGTPITASELANRGLLDGILGGLVPVQLPDLSSIPELGPLSDLVTTIANKVQAIEQTLAGARGKNVTSIIPTLTSELTDLQNTLSGLKGATSGLSGIVPSLTQVTGISALLARVTNSVARLVAEINTLLAKELPDSALTPITQLVSQVLASVVSVLDVNVISPITT